MESIQVSYFKILLVRKSHNDLIYELNLLLSFLIFEVIVLQLIKYVQHAIKCDTVNVI